jgi:hypothetical protein
MPKITDTYTLAYACCDDVLMETGKFPTIDTIRNRIGVNSPNTISNAIKAWTQAFAERQLDKQSRPDLPSILLESIEGIWKLSTIEAAKNYVDKEKALNTAITELQTTINQQQKALTQYEKDIEASRLQQEQLLEKIGVLEVSNTELTQNNKTGLDQIATLETQLINKETQLAEQEVQWQSRQDQDQQWFARRLDEEKTFMEQTWREKSQRQQETIQSLTLSEDSLRQTCMSLNLDHKKVMEELKTLKEEQKNQEKKRKGIVRNSRVVKSFK